MHSEVRQGWLRLLAGAGAGAASGTSQAMLDVRVLIKPQQARVVGALVSPHFTDKETETQRS